MLGTGSRRFLAQTLIHEGVRQALSARRIMDSLKIANLSFRKQDMLLAIRTLKGMVTHQYQTTLLGSTRLFPRAFMVETDLYSPRRYRIYAEVTIFDPRTGISETTIKSWHTDTLGSKADFAAEFIASPNVPDFFNEPTDLPEGAYVSEIEIYNVQHNRSWSY